MRLEDRATDAQLVVAVGRGESYALAELRARHGAVVYASARRFCGPHGADDVAQEVFLRLWQAPELFDPARGSLRSFLLVHARGRARDRNRSEASRHERERTVSARHCPTSEQADIVALDACVGERVRSALAALCETEREAITLAFFRGHSYQEVATLLRLPEGTVKSRIRSGLTRLRAMLITAGDELRFG
ncbi:MAG TPA: sigma-70 family RNA polymerase sigma factor [Acidimicrobiales bacterium]|nr:sigma-70 family RNA polymerase sigma factor [Acidimicrobiales bacterium]